MIVSKQFIIAVTYNNGETDTSIEKLLDKLSTTFNSDEFQKETRLNIFQTDAKLDKNNDKEIELIVILYGVSNDTRGIIKKIKSYIDTHLSTIDDMTLLKRRVYP